MTELGKNLSSGAPENGGFLVGSVARGNTSVYGLAQCWRFTDDCRKCLNDSFSRVVSCPPRKEGRAISAGCYLRYSTEKFYYNNTVTAAGGRNTGKPILSQEQILRFLRFLSLNSSENSPPFCTLGRRLAIILATTSAVVALLVITGIIVRKKVSRRRRGNNGI